MHQWRHGNRVPGRERVNMQRHPGVHSFFALSVCCLMLLFACCSSRRDSVADDKRPSELTFSKTPPFSTREPDRYQAVRTITSTETGSSQIRVSRSKTARDGSMRREEYETATGDSLVYLEIPAGRFVLLPSARLMADLNAASPNYPVELPPQALEGELSTDRLLNQLPVETRYQPLGTETVNGRSAMKYRVLTSSTASANSPGGETLIWVDDGLKMPVKWEIRTTSSDRQTKTVMELSEINLLVDAGTFALPTDYRRVNSGSLPGQAEPITRPPNSTQGKN